MMAQDNREVVPHLNQQIATMASHLRELPWMNPPHTFYRSKIEEDSQEFIDEVNKILFAIGLSKSEKAELTTDKLKDVSQTWYVRWRYNRSLRGWSGDLGDL